MKICIATSSGPKLNLSVPNAICEFRFGDTRIVYEYKDEYVHISSVRTASGKTNQGAARTAMQLFLTQTDLHSLPVKLDCSPLTKRTNGQRLFNFYKSLGFKPTGRRINPAGDPEMMRLP